VELWEGRIRPSTVSRMGLLISGLRAALVVFAAMVAGCSGPGGAKQVHSGATTQRDARTATPKVLPIWGIYAAVIRQLVIKDHGFGRAPSPYRHVYVRNAVVRGVGDPIATLPRPQAFFAESTKIAIASRLGDLPPLTFVSSPKQATVGTFRHGGWPHAKHHGVLITLGPVRWLDDRTVLVPNSRWATPLNGQWLTYRVKLSHGSWNVVGTVGPVVIS
jgi:hypothetical protein